MVLANNACNKAALYAVSFSVLSETEKNGFVIDMKL